MKTSPFLDEIRAEGRVEGRAASRAEDILRLLQIRFKVTPVAEVVGRLRQMHDLDRLSHWFETAATVNNYDDFLAEFARE